MIKPKAFLGLWLFVHSAVAASQRIVVDDNDPNIVYSGVWVTALAQNTNLGSTVHTTFDDTASATFAFNGTKIEYLGSMGSSFGNASCTLNAGKANSQTIQFNGNAAVRKDQVVLCSFANLDPRVINTIAIQNGELLSAVEVDAFFVTFDPDDTATTTTTSSTVSSTSSTSSTSSSIVAIPTSTVFISTTPNPTPSALLNQNKSDSEDSSGVSGGIIGAIIAAIIISIIAALAFVFYRKKAKSKARESAIIFPFQQSGNPDFLPVTDPKRPMSDVYASGGYGYSASITGSFGPGIGGHRNGVAGSMLNQRRLSTGGGDDPYRGMEMDPYGGMQQSSLPYERPTQPIYGNGNGLNDPHYGIPYAGSTMGSDTIPAAVPYGRPAASYGGIGDEYVPQTLRPGQYRPPPSQ